MSIVLHHFEALTYLNLSRINITQCYKCTTYKNTLMNDLIMVLNKLSFISHIDYDCNYISNF